ncbi:MAG: DNA polymerase III subunit gamma/tau [Bdellovibrionales bacterium]
MSSLFENTAESLPADDVNLFGDTPSRDTVAGTTEYARQQDSTVYRVLARKYRPENFDTLVGQDVLVTTLTNAFATGRIAQAWMLTGVRGTGKTTTARIIAKGLNCTGVDGKNTAPTIKPCGACPTCVAIGEDRCVDVLEVDAASRTGVDDMREILDGVRYAPVMGRCKVYIIDEVHMLSKSAFNALLKTLEEPPSHVKFVFATTEIRKVPVTVLSRCQRFDLRRVASDVLYKHFDDVCGKEGFVAEPEALRLIARAADGSVRDGLSLLDQGMARAVDNQITAADVQGMLGLADRSAIIELYAMLTTGNPAGALKHFDAMQAAGADALTVLHDIADLTHLLTRGKVLPQLADDTTLPEMDRQALQRLLPEHSLSGLTRIWQILVKGIGEVQQALHPAQAAAMVLVRIAYAATLPSPTDLGSRTSSAPQGGGTPSSGPSGPSGGTKMLRAVGGGMVAVPVATPISAPTNLPDDAPQPNVVSALSLDLAGDWRKLVALFLDKREVSLHAELYQNARLVSLAPGRINLVPGPRATNNFAGRVGQCLSEWTGDRWIVSIAREGGDISLAAQDKAADDVRRATAMAHPLVQAVMQAFPEATLKEVQERVLAVAEATEDEDNVADEIE